MRRGIAALLGLALVLGGRAMVGHAATGPLLQTHVTNKGLSLSLSIPKRAYHRRDRVTVTMTVYNVSNRSITLAGNPFARCASYAGPRAVVMAHHIQRYPPVGMHCPIPTGAGPTMLLRPGRRVTSRETLVLLGPQVRAFVVLPTKMHPGFQQGAPVVATPVLTIHLST